MIDIIRAKRLRYYDRLQRMQKADDQIDLDPAVERERNKTWKVNSAIIEWNLREEVSGLRRFLRNYITKKTTLCYLISQIYVCMCVGGGYTHTRALTSSKICKYIL